MIVELFAWWYGAGWLEVASRISLRVGGILKMFSFGILLRTLFEPWKRIVTPPAKSLDMIMKVAVDNLVSRTIGFFVRFFVIMFALMFMVIGGVIGAALIVIWPLLPPLAVYAFVRGVVG